VSLLQPVDGALFVADGCIQARHVGWNDAAGSAGQLLPIREDAQGFVALATASQCESDERMPGLPVPDPDPAEGVQGFGAHALEMIGAAESIVGALVVRVALQDLEQLRDGLVGTPGMEVDQRHVAAGVGRERIQTLGAKGDLQGFLQAAAVEQVVRVLIERFRRVGIQLQGAAEGVLRGGAIALEEPLDKAESGMGVGGAGVDLQPGARLGPYQILAPLGAGGMGEVYRARDTRLDREVAVKVLPERLASDAQALARFEREAKAVAALSHPNILTLYDIGSEAGIHYAVTELLEGQTLRQRLGGGAMPASKALGIAAAVAEGLAAAHAKGVIHRDIKPENIFLTGEGRVKILDFGLARREAESSPEAETVTQPGTVMGTAGYMSPEQVRCEKAEAASDIFSLGCVIYEMVAGTGPFRRQTMAETMAAILNSDAPPPAGASEELQRLVARCLEKNAGQRFQSAGDLAFALRRLAPSRRRIPVRGAARMAAAASLVLALAAAIGWLWWPRRAIDSIAILPFAGAAGETEYLSDGLTESLINSLSQLPGLRVVPRSTVFRYKGKEMDLQRVRRELNVRAALTGRVAQRGGSLELQVELVDLAADSQLWGRQYAGALTDLMALQEQIAKTVSERLGQRPTAEQEKRLSRRYTENAEAYQLYLRGRYYWNRRTAERLQRAVEHFQQAIEKDPGYALAWAGLADCYGVYGFYSVLSPREALPRGRQAAEQALRIDDTLAEPHASLAWIQLQQWDWSGAGREFQRAVQLNPNYATARVWYGVYLHTMGQLETARTQLQRALELEPLSLIINTLLGWSFCFSRQYDEGIGQLRRTIEIDPSFPRAHWDLGIAYEQKGRYAEAIEEFRTGLKLSGEVGVWLGALGHAYSVAGRGGEARKALAELREVSRRQYVPPFEVALIYAGLGDREGAFEWLERAYEDRSTWLCWLKFDPRFDGLRDDPRYRDLLRRMSLAP